MLDFLNLKKDQPEGMAAAYVAVSEIWAGDDPEDVDFVLAAIQAFLSKASTPELLAAKGMSQEEREALEDRIFEAMAEEPFITMEGHRLAAKRIAAALLPEEPQ